MKRIPDSLFRVRNRLIETVNAFPLKKKKKKKKTEKKKIRECNCIKITILWNTVIAIIEFFSFHFSCNCLFHIISRIPKIIVSSKQNEITYSRSQEYENLSYLEKFIIKIFIFFLHILKLEINIFLQNNMEH